MNFKQVEIAIVRTDARHFEWVISVDGEQYAQGGAPDYLTASDSAWSYLLDLNKGAHW